MKQQHLPNHSHLHQPVVPGHVWISRPARRIMAAALAAVTFIVVGLYSASAQQLEAQPTRFTVQSGVAGQVTNVISFTVDTNETVNLSVDISGATGVTSAVLSATTFTAPVNDVLEVTNLVLTVDYDATVPQTGANEIAVLAANAFNDRLPVPINAAVIWAGDTNNTAYETPGNWEGGAVPTSSDIALFPSAGATTTTAATNNVIISGNTELNGLRFSHGDKTDDESYRVEIKPDVTVSVTGVEGFTMLRDTVNIFDEMWVELFGGGNLVVSNSAANWSMLGESSAANDLVLNMAGLKSFTADVDRVGLGSYELYPNYATNGYGTEPDQWVPIVTLAETNFITTAWIGGEDVITNKEERPYAFTLAKMPSGGTSSGQQFSFLFGRTNVFLVESILFGGSGAKGSSDGRVGFNSDTNVIPEGVVPVAYFRGSNDTTRISAFAIADASGPGESGSSAKGNLDLRNGKVDALVDRLYVGRDRWKSSDNAVGQGELSIGGTNAAGTIFDVNTVFVAAQETGNNASDPEDDDDPTGEVYGTLNVGENAVLKVNGTLHLGYATADAADKRGVDQGSADLNVNGGVVMASDIFVGGVTLATVDNTISISGGGELIVTNTIGQTNKSLASLTMSDSTLTLHVDGAQTTPYAYADEVVTGGVGNTIKMASVVNVGGFPTQLPLIAYGSASPNFGVELPSGLYGYVVNNTVDSTIDVVILNTPPVERVWNGSPGTVWDTASANWQGPSVFANGDTARFDDTAASPSVSLSGTVFVGGSGVVVSNVSKAYTFSGAGTIGGTAPMNKWGANALTMNATSELPLTIHEGSVNGSGALGSTIVKSNTSLTFSGTINRLTSAGTTVLSAGSSVANSVTVEQGTLSNSGSINSTVEVESDAAMTVTSGGAINMTTAPGTSTVEEDATLVLDGTWTLATANGPLGTYRIDVFGEMKAVGGGNIQAGQQDLATDPPPRVSRLNIGAGGLLSLGASAGDIFYFTSEGRFDFVSGSRIVMDVDMDSADGSNPQGSANNGSATAKNSDVMITDRWSTMQGTLVLNNIGSAPFTDGTLLKLFKKPFDEFGFLNIPLNEGQLPVIEPALPGLGLNWDLSLFRTNGIISVVGGGPTTPPTMSYAVTNGMLGLAWPSNYVGWQVYAQTNTLDVGVSTNWTPIPGTTDSTTYAVEIIQTNPAVFYQLGLPAVSP